MTQEKTEELFSISICIHKLTSDSLVNIHLSLENEEKPALRPSPQVLRVNEGTNHETTSLRRLHKNCEYRYRRHPRMSGT